MGAPPIQPWKRYNQGILSHPPQLTFSSLNILQSTDPFEKPNVHVGYLNVDFDVQVLIAGGKAVREIFSTPPLRCVLPLSFFHHTPLTLDK